MEIDDSLKARVSHIVDAIRKMNAFLQVKDELNADQTQQIAFCCAETALTSLAAADEIDSVADQRTLLLWRELASALRQIVDHLLQVQEWQSAEEIKAHLHASFKHASFISNLIGLPESAPVEEAHESWSLVPLISPTADLALEGQCSESEKEDEESLRAEITALREALTSLVMERDHLVFVVCKELEAAYLSEFGSLEAEIYQADGELRYLRRRLELLQAEANRSRKAAPEVVEATLEAEFEEFKNAFEDFVRKVNETKSQRSAQKQCSGHSPEAAQKAKEADDREKQLKKLYRAIVRAMHPDLHPDQDEQTKDLFKRANLAYEEGDIKTLNEISGALGPDGRITAEYRLEELRKEKLRLLTMIRNVRAEIRTVKNRYPYTKKDILEDPVRLEQEKTALRERLEQLKLAAEDYRLRIERMENATWEN